MLSRQFAGQTASNRRAKENTSIPVEVPGNVRKNLPAGLLRSKIPMPKINVGRSKIPVPNKMDHPFKKSLANPDGYHEQLVRNKAVQKLSRKPIPKRDTRNTKSSLVKDVLPTTCFRDVRMLSDCVEEISDFYASDIHLYLRSVESKSCPQLDLSGEISESHRRKLVPWIRDVQVYLKMHPETFHLGITITDIILAKGNVKLQDYQLLGLVGILIAAKYQEKCHPEVDVMMYLASFSFNHQALISKEKEVLDLLGYDLNLPMTSWFLDYYTRDYHCQKVQQLGLSFINLFLMDSKSVSQFPPSIRAASALTMANKVAGYSRDLWQCDLEGTSGYTSEQLQPANRRLRQLIDGLAAKELSSLEKNVLSIFVATKSTA